MLTDGNISVDEADQLTEIRAGLSKVRFEQNPPWGIKALFTAIFRLIDVVEALRVDLAETRNRLAKHEQRLKGIETFEVSSARQRPLIDLGNLDEADDVESASSEEGVLDVFR